MRIIITIQHPGHVHFFKHAIREFQAHGHEVLVVARENEVVTDLLSSYGINHEVLAGKATSLLKLAGVQIAYETRLFKRARQFQPDVITGIGGVTASHVARLVGARSVVFTDTEHATLIKLLAFPFADVVCTPACYQGDIGSKQVRYPGVHELAYLHPARYQPDPGVLRELGCTPDDQIVVCRFSSWHSSHDVGEGGFTDIGDAVRTIDDTGATVVVSSEINLPPELDPYRYQLAPERMHDLLYHADVVVSEGATTASEAAVLGTPAVYVNSQPLGYLTELATRYGLVYNYHDEDRHDRAITRALHILEHPDPRKWARRHAAFLADAVDVTDVIVRTIERAADRPEDRPEPVIETVPQANP